MKITVGQLKRLIREALLNEVQGARQLSHADAQAENPAAYDALVDPEGGQFEMYGRYLIFKSSDIRNPSLIWAPKAAKMKVHADLPKTMTAAERSSVVGFGGAATGKQHQHLSRISQPAEIEKPAEPPAWRTWKELDRADKQQLGWVDVRDRKKGMGWESPEESSFAAPERPQIQGRAGYSAREAEKIKNAKEPEIEHMMLLPMDKLMYLYDQAGKKKSGGDRAKWERIQQKLGKAIRQKAWQEGNE